MFALAAFCWLFISLPPRRDPESSKFSYIKVIFLYDWLMKVGGNKRTTITEIDTQGSKDSAYKTKVCVVLGRQCNCIIRSSVISPCLNLTCRYLEMTIAPAVAKRVFQTSAFSQIFVGISHLGVVLGVLSIFLSDIVKTPLPWLRMGGLLLPLVWIIPFDNPTLSHNIGIVWGLSLIFLPISFGWAAGDLSLIRFIQTLSSKEKVVDEISVLGAVMSFLYASYIVIYNVLSIVLGRYIDSVFAEDGKIKRALLTVGGIQFTAISVFLLLNTLIPRGAFSFNPNMLFEEPVTDRARFSARWPQYRPIRLNTFRTSAASETTTQSDQKPISQLRYE